jgi:hypothetical protein
MTSATLTKIRFASAVLDRLDALALELRAILRRRVPRAALVRALVKLALDSALAPEVAQTLNTDPVRRGREKGIKQGRRRAS